MIAADPEDHAPSPEAAQRLEWARVIWVATVREDGRPHLAPIWFLWLDSEIYFSTAPGSVKARNLRRNPRVVMALEDGTRPVICEGRATPVPAPIPESVQAGFWRKYEWDLSEETEYSYLFRVTPLKWMAW